MSATTINIDENTKKEAQELLKDMGMNLSTAVNVFLKQLKGAKNTFWDWKSTSKSRIIRSIKGSRGNEEKSQYGKKIFFFKRNDKGHTGKWWITISDILDTGNKAIS